MGMWEEKKECVEGGLGKDLRREAEV